jgi:hypothetical protein
MMILDFKITSKVRRLKGVSGQLCRVCFLRFYFLCSVIGKITKVKESRVVIIPYC